MIKIRQYLFNVRNRLTNSTSNNNINSMITSFSMNNDGIEIEFNNEQEKEIQQEQQQFQFILYLNDEIKLMILSFLSYKDLLNLSQCSKFFHLLSFDKLLWIDLCKRENWYTNSSQMISLNYINYYHNKLTMSKNKIEFKNILKFKGKLPKRYKHTSTVYKDEIILIGGQESDQKRFNDVIRYSPKLNKFVRPKITGQVPNFSRHTSQLIEDKIYVFGGYSGSGSFYELAIYHPETNFWENIPNYKLNGTCPPPRTNHASAVIGDFMYIFGGNRIINGNYELLDDMYRFNYRTRTWEVLKLAEGSDTPTPRCGHCMEAINGKIYLFGGGLWNGNWMSRYNDIYVFDPDRNLWFRPSIKVPSSSPPETSTFSVSFVYGQFLFIFGGGDPSKNQVTNSIYSFDTILNTWSKLEYTSTSDHAKPRDMATASVIDNNVYICCGFAGGAISLFDKMILPKFK